MGPPSGLIEGLAATPARGSGEGAADGGMASGNAVPSGPTNVADNGKDGTLGSYGRIEGAAGQRGRCRLRRLGGRGGQGAQGLQGGRRRGLRFQETARGGERRFGFFPLLELAQRGEEVGDIEKTQVDGQIRRRLAPTVDGIQVGARRNAGFHRGHVVLEHSVEQALGRFRQPPLRHGGAGHHEGNGEGGEPAPAEAVDGTLTRGLTLSHHEKIS